MNNIVKEYLIKNAKKRQPVSYTDVNTDCKLGLDFKIPANVRILGCILGEISEFEYRNGRPLLSAIVMHIGFKTHGKGFVRVCRTSGLAIKEELAKKDFAFTKMNECFEFWSNATNNFSLSTFQDDNRKSVL